MGSGISSPQTSPETSPQARRCSVPVSLQHQGLGSSVLNGVGSGQPRNQTAAVITAHRLTSSLQPLLLAMDELHANEASEIAGANELRVDIELSLCEADRLRRQAGVWPKDSTSGTVCAVSSSARAD